MPWELLTSPLFLEQGPCSPRSVKPGVPRLGVCRVTTVAQARHASFTLSPALPDNQLPAGAQHPQKNLRDTGSASLLPLHLRAQLAPFSLEASSQEGPGVTSRSYLPPAKPRTQGSCIREARFLDLFFLSDKEGAGCCCWLRVLSEPPIAAECSRLFCTRLFLVALFYVFHSVFGRHTV